MTVALALSSFAFLLFAAPAWAQGKQSEETVSEAQKARIERLTPKQAEEQFVQAAQASDSSGDLTGERATVNNARNVIIDEANCTVDSDATIVFRNDDEVSNGGEVVGVANGENGVTISSNNRQVVDFSKTPPFSTSNRPTVLSSTGIDCGDPDNNDGFNDELLFLLLLRLLDNNGGDNGNENGDGGDGDNGSNGDNSNIETADLNGDGVVSEQERQAADAENDLNGEGTDGEDTNGDDGQYDDNGNGGVSASSDENGAEASTPGASARAGGGGDPDNLTPERSTQGDVVDEVPTTGPLPNTGGVPPVAAGTVLAMVLFGAGLLAVRLVMLWRESRRRA